MASEEVPCDVCGRKQGCAIYKNDPWCSGDCQKRYEVSRIDGVVDRYMAYVEKKVKELEEAKKRTPWWRR